MTAEDPRIIAEEPTRPGLLRRGMDILANTGMRLAGDQMVLWFHRLYYTSGAQTWSNTRWLGVSTQKCPLDLWVYQEILYELRPAIVVECGTAFGGSTLFLASIFDMLGTGEIVSIDVEDYPDRPEHDRVRYVKGSSTSPETLAYVRELVARREPVLVILDSDHRMEHVLEELRLYAPLVSEGSYLIVEDTNINGHPVLPEFGPGPMEAVERFIGEHPEFVVDRSREKLLMTFNPSGYLHKRSTPTDR
jgi:cephalosporin hydroxylase